MMIGLLTKKKYISLMLFDNGDNRDRIETLDKDDALAMSVFFHHISFFRRKFPLYYA